MIPMPIFGKFRITYNTCKQLYQDRDFHRPISLDRFFFGILPTHRHPGICPHHSRFLNDAARE